MSLFWQHSSMFVDRMVSTEVPKWHRECTDCSNAFAAILFTCKNTYHTSIPSTGRACVTPNALPKQWTQPAPLGSAWIFGSALDVIFRHGFMEMRLVRSSPRSRCCCGSGAPVTLRVLGTSCDFLSCLSTLLLAIVHGCRS